MSNHIADELPLLLTGEASHDAVLDAAHHLRICPDCREEMVAALVAHASLQSAQRFAPEIVARDVSAWPSQSEDSAEAALPDLSAVFAQVRAESSSPTARARARTRTLVNTRGRQILLAAAAVVAIGGTATAITVSQSGSSSAPAAERVTLTAYQAGTTSATATMQGGTVRIDAASLPQVDGSRYEVWVTNPQRTEMQPVGWLGSNGKASLTIPQDLMNSYSYFEVSRQRVDAPDYLYSGTSVLRGKY